VGVLFDYFRAPDGETALRLLDEGDGVPRGPATIGAGVDALDAKGIDPYVILGKLVGLILGVPWSVGLVETVGVWPPEETRPRPDPTSALRFVESLVALARRARQAGDRLYCWMCL
jgi:hypothetical protein